MNIDIEGAASQITAAGSAVIGLIAVLVIIAIAVGVGTFLAHVMGKN
jgi:hypothetical protein